MKKPWFSPTEYANEVDNATWKEVSKLKARSRAGEDVRAEIEKLKSTGKINDRIADDILKAKGQTLLREMITDARTTDNELEALLKAADPTERDEILRLQEKRLSNRLKKEERERVKGSSEYFQSNEFKRATTDDLVTMIREERSGNIDTKDLESALRKKAFNAQSRGTLTPQEVENIKSVLPDFNMRPSMPKRPVPSRQPVRPSVY